MEETYCSHQYIRQFYSFRHHRLYKRMQILRQHWRCGLVWNSKLISQQPLERNVLMITVEVLLVTAVRLCDCSGNLKGQDHWNPEF